MSNFSGFEIVNFSIDYYSGDFSGDDYYSGDFNITNNITKLCQKNCDEYVGNDDDIIGLIVLISIIGCIGLTIVSSICCDCYSCLIPCYIGQCCYSFKGIYDLYKEKKAHEKATKNYIVNYLNKLEQNIGFDCHCVICLDELDKKIRTLPCDHSFHKDCIHKWLKESDSKTCPICRKDVFIPIPVPSWKVVDYSSDSDNSYDEY